MLAAKFIVAKPVYLTSRTPARCGKRAPRAILGGRSSVAEPSGPQTKSPYDSIRAGLFWRLGFYLGIGADFGRSDNGRTPRFFESTGKLLHQRLPSTILLGGTFPGTPEPPPDDMRPSTARLSAVVVALLCGVALVDAQVVTQLDVRPRGSPSRASLSAEFL